MIRIKVELEFDGDKLGPKWMNSDNLDILLYSKENTRRDLLKVVSYEEIQPSSKLQITKVILESDLYSQQVKLHGRLVKWLYDNHRKILREYEDENGSGHISFLGGEEE